VPEWAEPAWHLFVVRHPARARFQQALQERGVGTLIHYPIPPHKQQAYAGAGFAEGAFQLASIIADEVLSLPMGPHLGTSDLHQAIQATLQAVEVTARAVGPR
jgi:dTDP-4-amino-4,6-dideoxygalactose transaminase